MNSIEELVSRLTALAEECQTTTRHAAEREDWHLAVAAMLVTSRLRATARDIADTRRYRPLEKDQ